ncbi:hypothetical protein KPSA1_06962 [Pseudomonas syringae pv. actinidiae]|uniref:Uncharacterized protein n=1 Tax=Pseudomonas syringae pv. actinidiae TaxID=103796 RepID=A0A2V0QK22_PSESF|nr:hypothetical protein KPSA1_06962 [Pseudomonas syringae pv. actinidiae]
MRNYLTCGSEPGDASLAREAYLQGNKTLSLQCSRMHFWTLCIKCVMARMVTRSPHERHSY